MNLPQFKTPAAGEVKQLHGLRALPGVSGSLVKIKHAVHRLAELHDGTLTEFAKHRHPDLPVPAALAAFADELQQFVDAALLHTHEFKLSWENEQRRAVPVVAAATRRMFACHEKAEGLNRRIARADTDLAERRNRLTKAGCSVEEAARLVPATDVPALQTERTALLEEARQLELYIKTKNEADLPPGFREKWVYPDDQLDTVDEIIRVDHARAAASIKGAKA